MLDRHSVKIAFRTATSQVDLSQFIVEQGLCFPAADDPARPPYLM
jgi:hypothetical protein